MVRSATGKTDGTSAKRLRGCLTADGGFTLIEVLVVVTIAAILTALVVLRLGSWRSGAEPIEQLERLAALIDYQCEQAMFQARPRGLRLTTEGYDFWQSTAEGWVPLPEDQIARAREWVGPVEVDLFVEDRRVPLEDEPPAPQLLCHPLGELTAFNLALRGEGESAALIGEPGGRLAVEREP